MILTSEGSNFYVVSSGLASGGYHLWLDFDDYDNGDFEGGAFNHYVRADNFFPVSSHNTGNTIVANFHGVSGTDDPRLEYFLFDSASGGNTLTITESPMPEQGASTTITYLGYLTTSLGLDNDGKKTGSGSSDERIQVEFVLQSDGTYKILVLGTAQYLEMLGGSNYGKMILTSEGSNFYVVSSGLASGGYHLWLDFDDYDNGDFEGGAFNHYVRADNFFPVSSHNTGNTIVANFHGVSGTDDPRLEYFLFDSASGGNTLTITENDLGRSSSLPPYP